MNTARARRPFHRPLKTLPWYVNCTLDPKEARKVAAHVTGCLTCQREIEALVKLFSARARTMPKRSVNEAQLDELFGRIDRYEAQRQRPPRAERSSLREVLTTGIFGWLTARPALVAGALAVVILGVSVVPMVHSPTTESPYRVLSSDDAAAQPLRVRLRFQTAPTPDTVERLVRASLNQYKLASPYRIEQRANGEYIVIFERKPTVAALSRLLDAWRGAPNVADVAIDGG